MTIRCAIASIVATLAVAAPLHAQETDELKERFAERYQALVELKDAGRVGETFTGFVEVVEAHYLKETRVRQLVEAENADRRLLYELLAADVRKDLPPEKRESVTSAVIGARNALRNVENAKGDHYLMMAAGTWIQKKDESRYRTLLELKTRGYVGETWEGFVEIVTSPSGGEAKIAALVKQENDTRRKRHEALAKQRGDVTAVQVGREKAKGYLQGARPDDFVKTSDGRWQRKKDLPKT